MDDIQQIALPPELRGCKPIVEQYVQAKIKQFAQQFAQRVNPNLSREQVDSVVAETLNGLAVQEQLVGSTRVLRLVLRHDCQSTGCGDGGCVLCKFNPSRLCKRNLKNKYLIDDHLKAKCGSALRVELVDEQGACVIEGLPTGVQLEVHVLNGEKYKEICPDNTLLSHSQLKSCVISHHTKALLKREGGSEDSLRCFLALERGQGPLSDLSVTTSSEALLAGKAPTFRLLVWAVDIRGEPAPNVTYVVSESFVVATKRVKHAIKSDIPSIADHVSKLVHIGKATVGKMNDLRSSAIAEGFVINVPDNLNCVDKVGQFQQLVHLSEMDSDLKNKVRHLLKLSPEKWDEVASHVLAAVVPDFRSRVWWCLHEHVRAGLLFECKNGSVSMDQPTALVKMGDGKNEETVSLIHTLDHVQFNMIPKLKAQAVQSWYAAGHPGWAIYWKEGQQDVDSIMQYNQPQGAGLGMGVPPSSFPELPNAEPGHGPGAGLSNIFGTGDSMGNMGSLGNLLMDSTVNVSLPGGSMNPGSAYRQAPQTFPVQGPPSMGVPPTFPVPLKPPLPSPFAPLVTQQTTHTNQPQMPGASAAPAPPPPGGEGSKSPFAATSFMDTIAKSFSHWPGGKQSQPQQQGGASASGANGPASTAAATAAPTSAMPPPATGTGAAAAPPDGGGLNDGVSLDLPGPSDMAISNYNSLEFFKNHDLLDRGQSLWEALPSADPSTRSQDWGNPSGLMMMDSEQPPAAGARSNGNIGGASLGAGTEG